MLLNWLPDSLYTLSPVSLAIALATLIAISCYINFKASSLPPGPTGVPFLGYWPFLTKKHCYNQLTELHKKYGDIYSFTVTGRLYINLGSFKAVREAHIAQSDCFGRRYEDFSLLNYCFGDGVGFINGESWKVLRKFFLQSMKERGMLSIKDIISGALYDSINSTIKDLHARKGEPLNIIQMLTDKCNTIFRVTMFGEGVSEELIREINEYYVIQMEYMTSTNLLPRGKIARYVIFPLMGGFREFKESLAKTENILYKIIHEHESTYNADHLRDVIDEYIKERNERRRKGDPTAQHFTDKALMSTLVQLVGDGVLSVAAFIGFFIKTLLDYPEEQDKIYKELVDVVGENRQPTIEDKSKLPYTNAFILETIRLADFLPVFPSLECTKETTIRGYRIPKGSITLLNTWCAHNDPEVYEEPEKFNPSRFITTEGKRRPELPITFGVGKRACIGEGFAMLQVFLFLTTIIKNFHLVLSDKTQENSYDLLMSGKLRILVQPRS